MAGVLSKTGNAALSSIVNLRASAAALTSGVQSGDPKKTAEAIRIHGYMLDMLTQAFISFLSGDDSLSVLGAGGEPIGWIGSDADKVGAWFKNLYVGGTDPDSAQLVADANGDLTITGGITAASISFWAPIIEADPFTDNDPAAGRVSWTSFPLYFAGTTYTIASGNTSSSTHKHIYWVRGASALTTATEMPQDIDNYLIASNISGVHELVLNKPGAGKSITEDALVPSLLKGMAGQPPASASINLASPTNTTIINDASGGGVITAVYVVVTTAVTAGCTAVLKIQIDGETEQSYPLYTAAATASEDWNAISDGRSGDMSALGDYRYMSSSIQFPYASSASVKFHVTSTGIGNVAVYVTRGLKTNM